MAQTNQLNSLRSGRDNYLAKGVTFQNLGNGTGRPREWSSVVKYLPDMLKFMGSIPRTASKKTGQQIQKSIVDQAQLWL
jgi:hypothetical protein